MPSSSRRALVCAVMGALAACQPRESLQVARDRSAETFLLAQIADLKRLVARAERGEITTTDRIAIGIAESVADAVLNASLPQEKKLRDGVSIRIDSARPFFRGNNAAIVFQATANALGGRVTARLELGGRLTKLRVQDGRLVGNVEMVHFQLLDTSLGHTAGGVVEALVDENLQSLSGLLPALEIPVRVEQSIRIAGLDEGIVVARAGALPLEVAVAETIPIGGRLWILLDAKAGPWTTAADADPR